MTADIIDDLGPLSWVKPRLPLVNGAEKASLPVRSVPTVLPKLRSVTAASLLAEPEPAFDWLAEGIIPATGVVVLAGDPKSFKTLKALQLAVVVGGAARDFLGRTVRHGPVVFVEEEGSRHKLRERIRLMSDGLGLSDTPEIHFALHEGVRLDQGSSVALLGGLVAEVSPRLVVLDPLVMLHSGDENKASEMSRVMRALISLAAEHDCCVVVVHHVNKPQAERKPTRSAQRLRGSSAFAGATDANLILDRDGDYTARLRGEYRDAEPVDLYLELDPATLLLTPTDPPESLRKVTRPDLLAYVRERGRVGVKLVADHFGVTRNTARTALSEAVAAGALDEALDGRATVYFGANV
ncbi:MAG TPA: AAA family ATPase [Candidatus Limnocylindria bacterium]|nr:AAA family ATPase [Candidatus Limnocylindria bacterium]